MIGNWLLPLPIDQKTFESLYKSDRNNSKTQTRVYHLGHSLVGQDMPHMLKQLSSDNYEYNSQLGWGTRLNAHWEKNIEISGFEDENKLPHFRPAHEAVRSGDYDVLILTEGIDLNDSIKYADSHRYLYLWSEAAFSYNPNIKVYLYETWHDIRQSNWLRRLDEDLPKLWEKQIMRRALRYYKKGEEKLVYVIPGGQVIAKFVRYIESNGGVGPIKSRYDLFSDHIHLNDYGAYLIALTHYSVIYKKSPVGLPYSLLKSDGSKANSPGLEAARIMQEIVWSVVNNYNKTGV